MQLHVYVHQIDAAAHPDQGQGWRWAVHSEPNPSDMASCLNAGWQPARYEALLIGEAAAVVGVQAALLAGARGVSLVTHELAEDPQPPAGLDTLKIMMGS